MNARPRPAADINAAKSSLAFTAFAVIESMLRPAFFLLLFYFSAVPAVKAEASQAALYDFQGDFFVLREGESEWFPAQKGQAVEIGDVVWSGEESFAEIALDAEYRNIFRVEKETKAEIRALDPADIYLENGTIYSSLEGIPSGGSYQIVTPTAVASVRGTHFYSGYEPAKQESQFALMPHEDQVESRLVVQPKAADAAAGAEVIIKEGQEAVITSGAAAPQIQSVSPQRLEEEKTLYIQMQHRVETAKTQTSGNSPIDLVFIKPGEKQQNS
jgi:hypothetical protein